MGRLRGRGESATVHIALPRCECAHAVRTVSAELSTHSGGLVVAFATNDILSSWCLVKIATNDSLSSASLG